MHITPKLGAALIVALESPGCTLTRCVGGFRDPRGHLYPAGRQEVVTRRTANALSNAMLAEFNDRTVPSAITLTDKGVDVALDYTMKTLADAA